MANSKELLARENAALRLRVSELEAGANLDKGIIHRLRQRIHELETKPSSSEPSSYANRVGAQKGGHISKKYGLDESMAKEQEEPSKNSSKPTPPTNGSRSIDRAPLSGGRSVPSSTTAPTSSSLIPTTYGTIPKDSSTPKTVASPSNSVPAAAKVPAALKPPIVTGVPATTRPKSDSTTAAAKSAIKSAPPVVKRKARSPSPPDPILEALENDPWLKELETVVANNTVNRPPKRKRPAAKPVRSQRGRRMSYHHQGGC